MRRAILVMAVLAIAAPAGAQTLPDWLEGTEVSVLFFGDAYWMAEHHDPAVEGENGFWIRRIYLTLDHRISERFDAQLRLEANSPGDFSSADRLDPFVKDAWLRWNGERTDVIAGLSSTPTWGLIEGFWGYRAVEKTPLDLQRMGAARDLGLALKGSFAAGERFRYHAMVGNGSGVGGETNEGKKAMLSLGFHPSPSVFAELYGDFEDRSGDEERTTLQGFVGWRWARGRAGLQLAHQQRDLAAGTSRDLDLASVFAVVQIGPRLNALARVDRMFDPNPEGPRIAYLPFSPRAESTFALAGLEIVLDEAVSVIPNVEALFYDATDGGEDPDSTLVPRVTLSVRF